MAELSIVIPTFDTASMTLGCCRAVLTSMPADSEIIVVDDGSSDGTAELLRREVPQARVIQLPSNRGFSAAANWGVGAAGGRIILLLNSDAMVEAASLGALVAAFDRDPALGVAGARLVNLDGTPQWSGGTTPTLPWIIGVVSGAGPLARFFRAPGNATRRIDWVSGAAMAFRSEVWKDAGPLDERFLFYCQDIEFSLRAREAGWEVRIVDESRITHGLGRTVAPHSLGHDPELLWSDLLSWGRSHYGAAWGMAARLMLIAAAAMRIAGRMIRRPLRRDATTLILRRALRRLLQSNS
jgi:GT2 family glycosyltransferase